VSAEAVSRLDDFFFQGVDFIGTPSEDDLWIISNSGYRHGIPHARFRHVTLNNYGLVGPDVGAQPPAGCRRILFVGGSETFGEPQVVNGAYPDEVAQLLHVRQPCTEILNGAIPGMSVSSIAPFYAEWASRAHPTTVVIYPSTHFYLGEEPPGSAAVRTNSLARTTGDRKVDARDGDFGLLDRSRFFTRLRDGLQLPKAIQRKRQRRWIELQVADKKKDWIFTDIPDDRIGLLRAHLAELIQVIRQSGAEPVLVTHAVSVHNPPSTEDMDRLFAARIWLPRATEQTIARFPYACDQMITALGLDLGVPVIDISSDLSGHPEYFRDLVHFTAIGRSKIASRIAAALQAQPG
jgi:hypothetical protein